MAGSAVEAAVGLFDRRFITNAVLPVLLFAPAVAALVLLQQGEVDAAAAAWDAQSTTLKLLEVAGYLALVWFLAAVLASQWGTLTKLFEGYPLEHFGGPMHRAAITWHRVHRDALADEPAESRMRYPLDNDRILPSALGNILRAAEDYPDDRYDAPLFAVWSRLWFVLPREIQENVEWARSRMELLLVVSAWAAAFAWLGLALAVVVASAGAIAVGGFVGGMVLAVLAYRAALFAAREYGNRLRAAFELHRMELLQRLGFAGPKTLDEEYEIWRTLNSLLEIEDNGHRIDPPADVQHRLMYKAPPPPELVLRIVLKPEPPQ